MLTRRAFLTLAAALGMPRAAAPLPVVAQGDSLTSEATGYASQVAAWLGRPLVRLAINGSTLREQAPAWLDAPAGLTLSLCGYNDMRRNGASPTTLAAYELALTGAATLARRRGPVALGGCLRMPPAGYALHPGMSDRGSDAAAAAYSAVVARVCARVGALYVDVSGYDVALTGPDLTHPTPAGQAWLAAQFRDALGRVWLPATQRRPAG